MFNRRIVILCAVAICAVAVLSFGNVMHQAWSQQWLKSCTKIRDNAYLPACRKRKDNVQKCYSACKKLHASCMSTGLWRGKNNTVPVLKQ